jgi:phosphocarrier protein HPr
VSRAASATVTIANKLGLHARPAMIFVEKASDFQAEIAVRRCDQDEAVDGKSIMQMMMLAATAGTRIEITATGADAAEAIRDLVALVESRFEEE